MCFLRKTNVAFENHPKLSFLKSSMLKFYIIIKFQTIRSLPLPNLETFVHSEKLFSLHHTREASKYAFGDIGPVPREVPITLFRISIKVYIFTLNFTHQ